MLECDEQAKMLTFAKSREGHAVRALRDRIGVSVVCTKLCLVILRQDCDDGCVDFPGRPIPSIPGLLMMGFGSHDKLIAVEQCECNLTFDAWLGGSWRRQMAGPD